jgi:dipeptidyl aminopeptidase/acylaminoacyl peptidase
MASPSRQFQGLLNQGIGVFTPNIRGSSGRGRAFEDLDNGPLRVNAIKDIKACFDYLVDNKIADPKLIGVAGHSGGGYLSMMAVCQFPKLFACGMESCGPLNLVPMAKTNNEWGGDNPTRDEDVLKSISPVNLSDRIEVPVMIQVGAKDDSAADARSIAEALKKRSAAVEYLEFPGEGHNFYEIKDRIKAEATKVEFFVRYLKPS